MFPRKLQHHQSANSQGGGGGLSLPSPTGYTRGAGYTVVADLGMAAFDPHGSTSNAQRQVRDKLTSRKSRPTMRFYLDEQRPGESGAQASRYYTLAHSLLYSARGRGATSEVVLKKQAATLSWCPKDFEPEDEPKAYDFGDNPDAHVRKNLGVPCKLEAQSSPCRFFSLCSSYQRLGELTYEAKASNTQKGPTFVISYPPSTDHITESQTATSTAHTQNSCTAM